MIRRIVMISFCGALALCATPQSKSSNKTATLTGCLDEQPGPQYVLRGVNELELIAKLEPDGFDVQAFAKYLGHRVTLKGLLMSDSHPVLLHVKTIKALSGSCSSTETPQHQSTVAGKVEVKTLTGCIDEQPGPKYILIGPETRDLRAELEPVGFPLVNFARFLGHSVSVRGELFSSRTPPLMRIKALSEIKDLADHCSSR